MNFAHSFSAKLTYSERIIILFYLTGAYLRNGWIAKHMKAVEILIVTYFVDEKLESWCVICEAIFNFQCDSGVI